MPQNETDAAKWLTSAAENGLAHAQRILGLSYAHGRGVPQSYALAYLWSDLAAAQGDDTGRQTRDAVASRMAPDELDLARGLVKQKREISPRK